MQTDRVGMGDHLFLPMNDQWLQPATVAASGEEVARPQSLLFVHLFEAFSLCWNRFDAILTKSTYLHHVSDFIVVQIICTFK